MRTSQEYFTTIAYAKFGGQTECIMGNWKIENKVLTSDPARQYARREMFLNFEFVFVYTVIRAREVRTS